MGPGDDVCWVDGDSAARAEGGDRDCGVRGGVFGGGRLALDDGEGGREDGEEGDGRELGGGRHCGGSER